MDKGQFHYAKKDLLFPVPEIYSVDLPECGDYGRLLEFT